MYCYLKTAFTYYSITSVMKSFLLLMSFNVLCLSAYCQQLRPVDELVNKMCASVSANMDKPDSVNFRMAAQENFPAYLQQYPNSDPEKVFDTVFLRLQNTCKAFVQLLAKDRSKDQNWTDASSMATSKMSKKECDDFFAGDHYYYLEPGGDTTWLSISGGYWIDHMADGTYSKLTLAKTSDADFELSFIQSNNSVKGALSKPGDKYLYRLIEKGDGFYTLCVGMPNIEHYSLFKIFYR
jgi:hypothetical protein